MAAGLQCNTLQRQWKTGSLWVGQVWGEYSESAGWKAALLPWLLTSSMLLKFPPQENRERGVTPKVLIVKRFLHTFIPLCQMQSEMSILKLKSVTAHCDRWQSKSLTSSPEAPPDKRDYNYLRTECTFIHSVCRLTVVIYMFENILSQIHLFSVQLPQCTFRVWKLINSYSVLDIFQNTLLKGTDNEKRKMKG